VSTLQLSRRDAARAEVKRRERLLHRAEELAGIGSFEWTPEKGELLWSDNLFRIHGYEPGEVDASTDVTLALTHPDDRDRLAATFARVAASNELAEVGYRVVLARGVRHLHATTTVVEERGGRPWRIAGVVQDVTERRLAEREIAAHFAASEALADWTSLEESGERLLSGLAEAMDFEAAGLWVPERDVLAARVLWRAHSVEAAELGPSLSTRRIPRGVGLLGAAWEAGEPATVPREPSDAPDDPHDPAVRGGLVGALALPAMHHDRAVAVLDFYSRSDVLLTPRLMHSLTAIGYQVGDFLARRSGELRPHALLTPRELQVLQLAARGSSGPGIAAELAISRGTVKRHFEHIYAKLGVSDRGGAVAAAMRLGLTD